MTTPKDSSSRSSSSPKSAVQSSSDLPPPRQRKALRSVSPPLAHTPLHRFIYYIALFAGLLFAYYAWRILRWKADSGGWWNLALGKKPPSVQNMQQAQMNWQSARNGARGSGSARSSEEDWSVEERINELASALGMPSKDLASAIAVAVRENVPLATLSSVSAHQTGEAVDYLVHPTGVEASESESLVEATATKGFKAMTSVLEALVGMDDPPTEMV